MEKKKKKVVVTKPTTAKDKAFDKSVDALRKQFKADAIYVGIVVGNDIFGKMVGTGGDLIEIAKQLNEEIAAKAGMIGALILANVAMEAANKKL